MFGHVVGVLAGGTGRARAEVELMQGGCVWRDRPAVGGEEERVEWGRAAVTLRGGRLVMTT